MMLAMESCVERAHSLRHASGTSLPPNAQPLPELPLNAEGTLYL